MEVLGNKLTEMSRKPNICHKIFPQVKIVLRWWSVLMYSTYKTQRQTLLKKITGYVSTHSTRGY